MINKTSQLLFFCLMLVFNNKILADTCNSDDLECQKAKAMEEAGIRPLATKDPEKTPDTSTADINSGSRSYELPVPSVNNRVVNNPGLDFASQNQGPETEKTINDAKQAVYRAPTPDVNVPQPPAPRLMSLRSSLTSGATPEIKPVGGSAITTPPGQQLAPSIYKENRQVPSSVQPVSSIYR